MTEKIRLADTEWKIMMVLWESAPLSCRQLEEALAEETGWTRHTIISFLKRMEAKGAIKVDETGKVKMYYPIIEKDEALLEETRSFAKKLFGGNVGLMVSTLVSGENITAEEIEEIRKILDKQQ